MNPSGSHTTATTQPLFRSEALDRQHRHWLGTITMVRPLSYSLWTALACGMGLLVVGFFIWGSYTQRSTLSGQLMPSTGLVRVHVPQAGVVLRMRVEEGQSVQQGQALFELGSDRQSASGPPGSGVQATVSARVRQRGDSLQAQMAQTLALQAQEKTALATRLALLKTQGDTLDAQIASQRQRTTLAAESEARSSGLVAQGFYSKEQAQLRQSEWLDQRVKLQGLLREQESTTQEIQARSDELRALPLRHQAQRAELDRNRLGVEQELAESESLRQLVIHAPQAGVVTAIVAEAGQNVDPTRALLSIVPAGSVLQAHLYAPSRAMGFLRVGDTVRLRYQAYPYQKFGQAQGVVSAIAKTALPAAELAATGALPSAAAAQNEPLYRVTATLQSQTMRAAQRTWPLQVSMVVEADVMQENRRLYEWVLEPLYGMAGKL
ncbi:colicin V secretion protein CvaA [Comamonadaceae bacterium OS-1]|nr:colicin V secretion protein CvaA [Comamonadaceae bacterium OS-1]